MLICSTLEVLQDRVPPRPFPEIERALARELQCPISSVFCEFEPQAKAAASLAQVIPVLVLQKFVSYKE